MYADKLSFCDDSWSQSYFCSAMARKKKVEFQRATKEKVGLHRTRNEKTLNYTVQVKKKS